ncbi:MAG: cysteine--tRNA ligase [Ardenticatenaceae bacterium]|nr:cysteine--tRNA ligase [Ardenticatenaceae bacterium]
MELYNTRTQRQELFKPQAEGVSFYVCGITPYDTTHLGHAFTYTTADILTRYLEYQGYTVHYVQNVTDIDDDILRKAQAVGEDWRVLGNRWTRHFIEDMQALNVRPPDHLPRATDVIPQIVAQVQRLLAAGVAYEVEGNVYFQVADWPEFGALSRIPPQERLSIANERGNHPDDPHKREPLDFVLWQAQAADDEPAWKSPWGNGRPGWHIECSTLATHFLGETIDIHSGGSDLLFPHHECEIAQVEPVTGQKPFVRFWLHTAMVAYEGEKMSKSLGNLVMVRDLLQDYTADALRIYLAQHHYREVWAHDEVALAKAVQSAERLAVAMTAVSHDGQAINIHPVQDRFQAAMDNDLDTTMALASLLNLADEIIFRAENGYAVTEAQAALQQMAGVFGLRLGGEMAESRVIEGWQRHLERFKD